MGRKIDEELNQQTHFSRILAKLFRTIFRLNNQQKRYSLYFNGWQVELAEYNFNLKEYTVIKDINLTQHDYAYGYRELLEWDKMLVTKLEGCFEEGVDYE